MAFKISIDNQGGSGGTTEIYYLAGEFYSDEECTTKITMLPHLPTKSVYDLSGFFQGPNRGGLKLIRSTGEISGLYDLSITSDMTIYAAWAQRFGKLTDYFGLDTDNGPLMLVKSESGAVRSVVETAGTTGSGSNLRNGRLAIQTANSAVGAFLQGPILANPVCTYRIRRPGDVVIPLGKAFGMATITGSGGSFDPYRILQSGYMMVLAEYSTSADGEPLLVVRGAANEGYAHHGVYPYLRAELTDAINQWSVTLRVSPDHVAQDPFEAVSGGGELNECKTLITCDPVVPMEDGHPCASDVVHGKIVVTGSTCAYQGESAPEASTPFIEINGNPSGESDVDYTSYSFSMERSL